MPALKSFIAKDDTGRPSYLSLLQKQTRLASRPDSIHTTPPDPTAARVLLRLPCELQQRILNLLSHQDLRSLSLVSKHFQTAVRPYLYHDIGATKYYRLVDELHRLTEPDAPSWAAQARAKCRKLSIATTCPNAELGPHDSRLPTLPAAAPPEKDSYSLGWIAQGDEAAFITQRVGEELADFVHKAPGIRTLSWSFCRASAGLAPLFAALQASSLCSLRLIDTCTHPAAFTLPSEPDGAIPMMEAPGWDRIAFASQLTSLELEGGIVTRLQPHASATALDELLCKAVNLVKLRLSFKSSVDSNVSWVVLSRMDSMCFPNLISLDTEYVAAPSGGALERFLSRLVKLEDLTFRGPAHLAKLISSPEAPSQGTFAPAASCAITMPCLRSISVSSQRLLAAVLRGSAPRAVRGAVTTLDPAKALFTGNPLYEESQRPYAIDGDALPALSLCSSVLELMLVIRGSNRVDDWLGKLDRLLRDLPPSLSVLQLRFPDIWLGRRASQIQLPLAFTPASLAHMSHLRLLVLPSALVYPCSLCEWNRLQRCRHVREDASVERVESISSQLARVLPALDSVVFLGSSFTDEYGMPIEDLSWRPQAATFALGRWFQVAITRKASLPLPATPDEQHCMEVDDDVGRKIYLSTALAAARHEAHQLEAAEKRRKLEAEEAKKAEEEAKRAAEEAAKREAERARAPTRQNPPRKAKRTSTTGAPSVPTDDEPDFKRAKLDQKPPTASPKTPPFSVDTAGIACLCRGCYGHEDPEVLESSCEVFGFGGGCSCCFETCECGYI